MAARGVSVRGSGDTRTPHKPEGILVAFLFLYWFGMVSLSPYCVGMSFWVTVSMRFVYKPSRLMTTFLSLCQCTSLQQESCTYCRILTAALWVFSPLQISQRNGKLLQLLWPDCAAALENDWFCHVLPELSCLPTLWPLSCYIWPLVGLAHSSRISLTLLMKCIKPV